jgi:hypothetical protein
MSMSVRCIQSKGTKGVSDVPVDNITEYKTVALSRTKNVWLDRNLGATRPLSSLSLILAISSLKSFLDGRIKSAGHTASSSL